MERISCLLTRWTAGVAVLLIAAAAAAAAEPLPPPQPSVVPFAPVAASPSVDGGYEHAWGGESHDADHSKSNYWINTEYLLWWVKGQPAPPPLVTTGPAALTGLTGGVGVLGANGTSVLLGGGGAEPRGNSGGRFSGGAWLNDCHSIGVEAGYFFLGQQSTSRSVSSPTGARVWGSRSSTRRPAWKTVLPLPPRRRAHCPLAARPSYRPRPGCRGPR